MAVDLAGNSFKQASSLNLTSNAAVFKDQLNGKDRNDYLRFNLGSHSKVNVNLSGLKANANLQLLNSVGQVLQTSSRPHNRVERILTALEAGTYVLRVYAATRNVKTSYTLRVLTSSTSLTPTLSPETSNPISLDTNSDSSNSTNSNSTNVVNNASSVIPQINVSNPTIGDRLNPGTNYEIQWVDNFSENVKIDLYKDNAFFSTIATSALNTGNYIWTLPSDIISGSNFQIRVSNVNDSTIFDNSDGSFSIASINTDVSTADLTGAFLDVPATSTAGNTLSVHFQIQNTGTADAGSFLVGFYLSHDAVISNDDYFLNTYQIDSLATGATTATLTNTTTLPIANNSFWVGTDTYYIGMAVDSLRAIAEISENNNSNGGTGIDFDSTAVTVVDWFDQNVKDTGLRTAARSRFSDRVFDRTDMIAILQDAKDGSVIDTTEFNDLKNLVNNVTYITMPGHVRVLSKKVVNANTANQRYQGNLLGNLYGGSSATQMQNLIDKWFFGLDRPSPPAGLTMSYQFASGSLFGNDGIFTYQDVDQGYLGDCYFLGSLAANAMQRPSVIQNMFIDNGDGTFTVRFYGQHDGQVTTAADYVTVDRYLPTNVTEGGYTDERFANFDDSNVGLWVALAEKAYAQFAEQNMIDQESAINSYGSIEGGNGFRALPSISGTNGGLYSDINYIGRVALFPSIDTINNLLAAGTPLLASSIPDPSLGIYSNHQYMIVSANTLNQSLLLYNPHGQTSFPTPGEDANGFRTISYADLRANFDTVEFA
jgi:hypothetical protein